MHALTGGQRQDVERMTHMLELKRGGRIYLPGDPSDQIFLLKTGVVKISGDSTDRDTILALLYPGDIFGELAIVDETPRDHIAEAMADTVLCALSRDAVLRLLRQSPELGYQITKMMGRRIHRYRTRVETLLFKSAPTRVAHTLLDLAADYGVQDDAGLLIPLRLNQTDIGNLVGLARETVNIVLQDLRTRGLVETGRTSIRLPDPERLRTVT